MDVWSDVVDYGVAFQQRLREKEAWIALAKERKSKRHWGLAVLRDSIRNAAAADDQYIGLWINRASEDIYLSYLPVRVPCFMVHEFPMANYTPTAVNPCLPTFSNFVDGTDIGDLIHRNTYDVAPVPLPRITPDRPSPQLADSAETSASPRPPMSQPGPSQHSVARSVAPGTATPTEARPERMHVAQPSNSLATRYMASEIQWKCVDEARAEWVVPPLVARASKKSNGHFEVAEYNDKLAWIFHGAKAKYDQELGWCLHFGRYMAEEGVLDDDVFGTPVPRLPFFTMDRQIARPQQASSWMYRTRSPTRGNEGRRVQTPPPTRLPWAPRCGPSPKEGGSSKGKGKHVEFNDSDDLEDGMALDDIVPPTDGYIRTRWKESKRGFQGISSSKARHPHHHRPHLESTTPRILTPDYGTNLAFAAPFAKRAHHVERLPASSHCASRHDTAAVSSSNGSTRPTSDSSYTIAGSSQKAYCAP
ncbi:hypothetical protein DFH08DRAFT_826296 [Mycena albidolilacea]|uniref:Uncharacterized protein n=1 Tax=Mycena albidolilacea TaxID=1033008 RepID=A0AAD7E8D2_9AGAR|nr:hypothetical protein DFH08DRAFT_826296 [Mycena albidolilacea]